jgi:hypothetical protein
MAGALIRWLGSRTSLYLLVLVCVLVACATGCATTGRDSDLPWNMQQPWETAPTIPGFSPR